jgi:glutamate-5-semialdehyde dehydrogenase
MSAKYSPQKLLKQLTAVKSAAATVRGLGADVKNAVLLNLAQLLQQHEAMLLAANEKDLKSLKKSASGAYRDRLTLNRERIAAMAQSLKTVAALPDPVGEVLDTRTLSNGLKVKRVRSPIGVIFVIFESRPNVAIEAFSLAFKAGNAILLKAGKESTLTTGAIYTLIQKALTHHGIPDAAAWGLTAKSHTATARAELQSTVASLLKQNRFIDLVIPRGGDGLIHFVANNATMPILKNDRGLCHIYVDDAAPLAMAESIIINAKTSRPGVCNAVETVLIHQSIAKTFLPQLYLSLQSRGVALKLCTQSYNILKGKKGVARATKKDFHTEWLDLILNVRIVSNLNEALTHIADHGSRHSECIVTTDEPAARRFQAEVDAAAVYWNASTRFTDGYELGLGAEIGISTDKVHARGPIGLSELTTPRWLIDGYGQVRL